MSASFRDRAERQRVGFIKRITSATKINIRIQRFQIRMIDPSITCVYMPCWVMIRNELPRVHLSLTMFSPVLMRGRKIRAEISFLVLLIKERERYLCGIDVLSIISKQD
uniref:Uncharacterized protein n=1 Tax=Candidatus Kentrum sp. MB TaxID=2138164 RepID=A0A450XMS6_9GAMM|nr:MAG: hypothetical protein BECKMB1821G_GA0114241_10673 [Candidatus Kentron sp. MB]VFK34847.1 MAG: hypothetical protein BECKMB1821I_GA0114274_10873 [Candidatus Kentron sp. MB]VFK77001.1 MAG: hypothetical protein BECKMB1821H_GA0114242_10893 [Candidatus Kentron sp. MB]